MRLKYFLGLVLILLLSVFYMVNASNHLPIIDVDPSTTHQTMRGWEAATWAGDSDDPNQLNNHGLWVPKVHDIDVNEVGINRIRLEVRSGNENPGQWNHFYYNTQTINRAEWRTHWYEIIDDNFPNPPDPFNTNLAGFDFAELDHKINVHVIPLRNLLLAKNERLYINLNYVSFSPVPFGNGDTFHSLNPDEYAEYILTTFQYMDNTYGFVPDGLEIMLEPDFAGWGNGQVPNGLIGPIITTTVNRLAAAGYNPEIIAPSNTNMWNARIEISDLVNNFPQAAQEIVEVSTHMYSTQDLSVMQGVTSAAPPGVGISMLELWEAGNTYSVMHDAIRQANAVAWQLGVLGGDINGPDPTTVTDIDFQTGAVQLGQYARYFQQYFRNIRMGARRITADSTDFGLYDPIAFTNTDGSHVVVVDVQAPQGGSFEIQGLPAGDYASRYTTAGSYDQVQATQTIGPGGVMTFSIPEPGVITIYQPTPPPPVIIGDVSGNNNVDNQDVLIMVDHIIGVQPPLSGTPLTSADTTCDNNVDVRDILLIFRSIIGLANLPASCP